MPDRSNHTVKIKLSMMVSETKRKLSTNNIYEDVRETAEISNVDGALKHRYQLRPGACGHIGDSTNESILHVANGNNITHSVPCPIYLISLEQFVDMSVDFGDEPVSTEYAKIALGIKVF